MVARSRPNHSSFSIRHRFSCQAWAAMRLRRRRLGWSRATTRITGAGGGDFGRLPSPMGFGRMYRHPFT